MCSYMKSSRAVSQKLLDVPCCAGHQLSGVVGLYGEVLPVVIEDLDQSGERETGVKDDFN